MTRKQKRFIKNVNRSNRDPNTGYQDKGSGQYYITDDDGKFLKFASKEEAQKDVDDPNTDTTQEDIAEDTKIIVPPEALAMMSETKE